MGFRWMSTAATLVCSLTIATPGTAGGDVGFDSGVTYRVPLDGAPALGPDDAPVTIVEFSDFYCPHCNRSAVTLADLTRIYPGRIRVVYRHNLLDPEEGTLAAEAVLAADAQGKFWPMHDLMFASSESITRGTVEEYAEQVGLDIARFRTELDNGTHRPSIRRDLEVARGLGVTATPMIFVNGRPITGAQPLGVFIELVEQELARADEMIVGGVEPGELYEALTSSGPQKAHAITQGADTPAGPSLQTDREYSVGRGIDSHQRGLDDALVTIVEFSDFECSFCRKSRRTLGILRKEFGDDIRLVYRHKPLTAIGNTKLVAEAAVAAGEQGKFWEFHDLAYAHSGPITRADIEQFGSAAGLDMARFRQALDDRRYLREVILDAAEAASIGVRGTPTFFVNGTPVIGAVPVEQLRDLVEKKRTEAEALVKSGIAREDVYEEVMRRALEGAEDGQGPDKGLGPDRGKAKKVDAVDYHIAVLVGCRAGDGQGAAAAFKKVEDKRRRDYLRKDCKRLGIVLPK